MNMTSPPRTKAFEQIPRSSNVAANNKQKNGLDDANFTTAKLLQSDWKGRTDGELIDVPRASFVDTEAGPSYVKPSTTRSNAELTSDFVDDETPRKSKCVNGKQDAAEPRRRELLLVFIRIIFKCLDQHADHEMRLQAKQIVRECTQKNREREPGYENLVDVVQTHLREFLGDVHWRRAEDYLQQFILTRRRPVTTSVDKGRFGGRSLAGRLQPHPFSLSLPL